MATDAQIEYFVLLGATSVAAKPGSFKATPEIQEEALMSGQQLTPQAYVTTQHLPQLGATLYDVDLVTTATPFGSTLTPASFHLGWRQRAQNGLDSTYIRASLAQGMLVPVSLNADANKPAELEVMAIGLFSGTTGHTLSTTSAARATPVTYRLSTIVLGGTTLANPKSLRCNWKYAWDFPPTEVLPTSMWVKEQQREGSFVTLDLAAVTVARLQASSETLVATFVNHANAADTISVDLGTVRIKATISGNEANFAFAELDVA